MRKTGILMPVSALPSSTGVGELGLDVAQLMLQVFVRTECHRFEFHLVGTCGAWCPCLGVKERHLEFYRKS